MNTNMYHNPILQDNLKKAGGLWLYGDCARKGAACLSGYRGWKNASEDVLVGHILREIAHEKDLAGMKVIVTAGPTQESVDPVRYITNHSTGKMGYEPVTIFILAPGAFFVLAFLSALQNKFKIGAAKRGIDPSNPDCKGGCASCGNSMCSGKRG